MTTGDKDRLEQIKKEEQEDASSYYAQGEKESFDTEGEFKKPVPGIPQDKEEMSLLKAVAFLGFGLASFAIIFILFFIRDLDDRVGSMDANVVLLEKKIAPLKEEIDANLNRINTDLKGLSDKVGNYERKMAIMELKRALVTVREMYSGASVEVDAKSQLVIASIEALLQEFGAGEQPAGVVKVQEAPIPSAAIETPALEPAPVAAETVTTPEPTHAAVQESTPAATEPAPVVAEPKPAPEPAAEDGSGDDAEDDDEEDDDEDEDKK